MNAPEKEPNPRHLPLEAERQVSRPKKANGIAGFLGAIIGVMGGILVGGVAPAFFMSGNSPPFVVMQFGGLGATVGAIAGGLIGASLAARRNKS